MGPLVGFLVGTGLFTLANGTFNLLVAPVVASRGHTEVVIGAIVAAGSVASFALRIPTGNVFRTGRTGALIASGSLFAATGYGVLPLVSSASALAGLSVLQGAGFAVATTAAMAALLERHPPGMRPGPLMGWYTGSIGAGYALAGFIGGTLADASGLRGALAMAAVAAIVAGWLMTWSLARSPARARDAERHEEPLRGWVRGLPPGVWLGAAIALYINVVNGGLNAFFPLYALGLGLTLTQIGLLSGIHATLASAIRFGAGTVLERASYRVVLSATIAGMGLAVTAIALPSGFVPLAVLLAVIGFARGILRVASGAIVMDSAGPSSRHRGRASGIYLAGLDLGNAVGPLLGGLVADVAGLRGSFPFLGLVPAAVFLGVGAAAFRRLRPAGLPRPPVTPGEP